MNTKNDCVNSTKLSVVILYCPVVYCLALLNLSVLPHMSLFLSKFLPVVMSTNSMFPPWKSLQQMPLTRWTFEPSFMEFTKRRHCDTWGVNARTTNDEQSDRRPEHIMSLAAYWSRRGTNADEIRVIKCWTTAWCALIQQRLSLSLASRIGAQALAIPYSPETSPKLPEL